MNNEITINLEEIAKAEDGSIRDTETIRQIALHSIRSGDTTLTYKIDPMFAFAGLYPQVISVQNVQPEITDDILHTARKKYLKLIKNRDIRE
jgi:hypothetical protein